MARRSKRRGGMECPHCGEWVEGGALACKACGSDARTGWSEEDASFDEEGFDYEDFLAREGLAGRSPRTSRTRAVLGAIVLAIVLLWLLRMSGC